MSKVTIELTENVAKEFLNGEYNPLVERLKNIILEEKRFWDLPIPFNSFSIKFPTEALFPKEQLLAGAMRDITKRKGAELDEKEFEALKLVAKMYVDEESYIIKVDFKDREAKVNLTHTVDKASLFRFKFGLDDPLLEIEFNNYTEDPKALAGKLIYMIKSTLDYINKPRKSVVVTRERETKKTKKGKKGKKGKSNKTYIYKKVYKVLDVEKDEETVSEKRDYNRTADSWEVRGHWRHYKSGKKVWIKGYVKGNTKDKPTEPKNYKITKID